VWTELKNRASSGGRASAKSEDLSGKTLGGYKILEIVGKGGMGTVYRATQISMNREVALKVLTGELARDSEYVQRFIREARVAAALDHPNLIRALDVGEAGGIYYFSMEFVSGSNVSRIVKEKGYYEPAEAVSIIVQVARALLYAHEKGMIHRDVKPENIMIDEKGNIKLADLGLAKRVIEAGGEGALTAAGQAMGTPYYMSPEQVTHARDADHRTDIYSLGATLYSMVTGKPPFAGQTAAAIMANVVYGNLIFPHSPQLPAPLIRVIRNMMQKEPAKRYSNMGRVVDALEELLGTNFRESRRDWSEAVAQAAPAKRNKPLILAAAAGSILLIVILAVLMSGREQKQVLQPVEPLPTASATKESPAEKPEPAEQIPHIERTKPVQVPREDLDDRARDDFRKALEFDSQHADSDYAQRIALFASVFEKYPASQFATHARDNYNRLKAYVQESADSAVSAAKNEKNFDARLSKLQEFLKRFPDTEQVARIQQEIEKTKQRLARKFKQDMTKSTALAEEEKFDEAQTLLDSIREYATQELIEKAVEAKKLIAARKEQIEKEKAAAKPDTKSSAEVKKPEEKTVRKADVTKKIFNGKNLNGFKTDQKVFQVSQGQILANHTQKGAPAHLLLEAHVEGDFTFSIKLVIEAKQGENTSFGGGVQPIGAGISFGCGDSSDKGYKFWTDAVYGGKGNVGLEGGRFARFTGRSAGSNWIAMTVEVENKRLTTYFNGEKIQSEDFREYKGGRVGVFVHQCNARFKELLLCEKKPKEAEESAADSAAAPEEKANPREEPVAKEILEKLEQVSPRGFVAVPAGDFLMGAESGQTNRENETPQHKVYVDAFFISKYEVTQKEYKPFIDETGTTLPGTRPPGDTKSPDCPWAWRNGTYPPGTENHPLVAASWSECDAYCKWLSKKTGRTYRLPTEAEWEKAASWNFLKGEKYKYPWGNTPPAQGWFRERPLGGGGSPVGTNPHDISFCGCYDMLHNVGEFCLDVYENNFYERSPNKNPRGPRWPPRSDDQHVIRGSGPDTVQPLTFRTNSGSAEDWRPWHDGFRVVLEPSEKERLLIEKIVSTKGKFDVEAYLQKEKTERLDNYEKFLFKGSAVKKGNAVKVTYSFEKVEQLNDWLFAHDITKPNATSTEPEVWCIADRALCGGGKVATLTKAVFTGDATFDVRLQMKSPKNLVIIVASTTRDEACAACFAIDAENAPFLDESAKVQYENFIFALKKGKFEKAMISCKENELTIKDGKAICSGELDVMGTADSSILNRISAKNLSIGGSPIGSAAKCKLKPKKDYLLSVKIKEGFALFYLDKDFLGFAIAPEGQFRFGVAACGSLVDVKKVELSGKLDPDWLKKELGEHASPFEKVKEEAKTACFISLKPGGKLNETAIDSRNSTLTVSPGVPIRGTIRINVRNDNSPNAVVPVVYTPTWGAHKDSWREVDPWISPGSKDYEVPMSLTAPTNPGTYYIIFASAGQTASHYVASMTAWPRGSSVWDDGNDLADLTDAEMKGALSNGFASVRVLDLDGTYKDTAIGCTYIKIIVRK
jgi:serine/threonine-protein kinase